VGVRKEKGEELACELGFESSDVSRLKVVESWSKCDGSMMISQVLARVATQVVDWLLVSLERARSCVILSRTNPRLQEAGGRGRVVKPTC
jgi:hypothetical protein